MSQLLRGSAAALTLATLFGCPAKTLEVKIVPPSAELAAIAVLPVEIGYISGPAEQDRRGIVSSHHGTERRRVANVSGRSPRTPCEGRGDYARLRPVFARERGRGEGIVPILCLARGG